MSKFPRSNCRFCNRSFKFHSSRQIHEQSTCPRLRDAARRIVACDELGHADQADLTRAAIRALDHDRRSAALELDELVENIADALYEDAGRVANSDLAVAYFVLDRVARFEAIFSPEGC